MWLVTNVATGNVLIVIREKPKYTIGRTGADLVITDDSSISRTHAFLHIKAIQEDSSGTSLVTEQIELEDAGSKYGTFHNDGITKNSALPKQKKIALTEGDRIRFGVLKSIWKVSNITPFVAISVLPQDQAQQLKQYMDLLGGCVINGWSEKYTHLTLAEIKMTSKLLHALLDDKPIVTCDYWCSVVQAARRGRHSMPQVTSFVPPNPNNFDLAYHAKRHQLFKNLTFVFMHAHHFRTYASIVEKAGGKGRNLNEGLQKSFLIGKDVVVIQYVPSTESQSSQTINTVEHYLTSHSRRTVPEFEIGLAIIQCSTEKYCNPGYNPEDSSSQIFNASESDDLLITNHSAPWEGSQTEVFIPETDNKGTDKSQLTNEKRITNQTTGSVGSSEEPTGAANVESQQKNKTGPPLGSDATDTPMSALQVTESQQESNKRKAINSHMDSDEDDLFDFAAKKAHLDQGTTNAPSRNDDIPTTSAAARQALKSAKKQLPIEVNKKRPTKKTVITGFLEKSQAAPAIDGEAGNDSVSQPTSKAPVKRARIADIDNSDDDDLFCFGGEEKVKDSTTNSNKRARMQDDDEDLFDFGGGGVNDEKTGDDNPGQDVIDAEAITTSQKQCRNAIVMPKPKPLPAKICVSTWLDCSLSALHIKAEEVKKEEEQDGEKPKKNDSDVTVDSKYDVETIKGGCIVTVLSTKSLRHERDLSSSKSMERYHSNVRNFKKFLKKFQPTDRRVIRTVSSAVCGSLI